jgi:hypothetical protein
MFSKIFSFIFFGLFYGKIILSFCSKSLTTFQNKLATVTGPTPPGTGVIAETLSKILS